MTATITDTFTYDHVVFNGVDFSSTAIDTIAYNAESKELYLEFVSGGEYVYEGVAESTYNLLVSDDSVGRFYRDYIQGKYTARKVDCYLLEEREEDQPEATPTYRKGDRVEVFDYDLHPEWNGPGIISDDFPEYPGDNIVIVDRGKPLGLGGFDSKHIRLLTEDQTSEPDTAYSRYSVRWESGTGTLGGNPEYDAIDESDALLQFWVDMERSAKVFGSNLNAKIVSVTHYF